MPPKAKYTREEIVQIALDLISVRGLQALNARNLAAALGTSTRPLFTAFKNMGEIIKEVHIAAMKRFEEYALRLDRTIPAFKSVGMQMIMFAAEQPNLFQMLFMNCDPVAALQPGEEKKPSGSSFEDLFNRLGATKIRCIEYIQRDYGLNEEEAKLLFRNVWLFTYGICSLIAKGICRYSEQEVSYILSLEFRAVMGLILSGKAFDLPEYERGISPEEFKAKFSAN